MEENIFDLELNEFRNNATNLDLTGLSTLSLPNIPDLMHPPEPETSQHEEIKLLSSKVQCLEQQLNQFLQTMSYCFDMIGQFQTLNTKFQSYEKLLNTTVSDVAALKSQNVCKSVPSTHTGTNNQESQGAAVGAATVNEHITLHEVDADPISNDGHRPGSAGSEQIYNTQASSNILDTQTIEPINIGDTNKIPDEPEAAAVPNSNENSSDKMIPAPVEENHDQKNADDLDDVGVGVDNFDYADYELNSSADDDLVNHHLNSIDGHAPKEIPIDDIELDEIVTGGQNHFYSTLALDDLVKFGVQPSKPKKEKKISEKVAVVANGNSHRDSADEDNERVDPCNICGKVLSRPKDMKRHMQTHVKKTLFPCPDCGKYFNRKDAVKKHQRQNQCSKLDQVRYQTELLQNCDRRKVSVENSTPEPEETKCEICGKTFSSRQKLKGHYRNVHSIDKKFLCPECGKTFCRKVNLEGHLRQHEKDETAHRCETCGQVFARNFDLVRHEKSHDSIKEFKCDQCGLGFSRGSGLTKHIQRVHTPVSEDRNHICDHCGGLFQEFRTLMKHKRLHDPTTPKNWRKSKREKPNGISLVSHSHNGIDDTENGGRQQLSELKNIIPKGDQSPTYQLFDLPSLENTFGADALR